MQILKNILFLVGASTLIMSCTGQVVSDEKQNEPPQEESEKSEQRVQHNYGGWYCPDNLGGFPPVDIAQLELVPVVEGRLPTHEEASNGTSLMYIDTAEYPDARALDISLPKLAKYYNIHSQKKETVIVIQAVVIGVDTVVGFRFASGGNGSSWYSEVEFYDENTKIESSPFVFVDTVMSGTQEEFWKSFIKTSYAQKLGERFDKKEYFDGAWVENISTQLHYRDGDDMAEGIVMNMYGAIYLQIDYSLDGKEYTEKVFFMTQAGNKTTKIHVVAGPITRNFEAETEYWNQFLDEMRVNWFSLGKG